MLPPPPPIVSMSWPGTRSGMPSISRSKARAARERIGGGHRGAEPLVLAELGGHLRGDAHGHARQPPARAIGDGPLVVGMEERVEEADGEGLDACARQVVEHTVCRREVEG